MSDDQGACDGDARRSTGKAEPKSRLFRCCTGSNPALAAPHDLYCGAGLTEDTADCGGDRSVMPISTAFCSLCSEGTSGVWKRRRMVWDQERWDDSEDMAARFGGLVVGVRR